MATFIADYYRFLDSARSIPVLLTFATVFGISLCVLQ